ncbi:GerMN domain-containing protein [Paenarthrobacter sp. Z7-10]|uniref:LpqB family beta-propeller domain-containing protein n=1 Tax=Paenarthrobacter sp. Z7-10 TaxID=2787635 RepID=UPI0022A9ED0F|nr:LpqB family beta-propeller domain-containing protein [Paenarthrobacter sp. Z7-10]MCZ2402777.1 GerMN domain-containing protein [Paenarthrobacter sp. Z7-10]
MTVRPLRKRIAQALCAGITAVLMLLSAGCAAIPKDGPVGRSDLLPGRNNPVNIDFRQNAPVPGASAASIVEGFIAAGTGVADDFQVARQYLDRSIAKTWKADTRTLVYQGGFKAVSDGSGSEFKVDFDVESTVDPNGIRTPAAPGAVETVKFSLTKVDGEWRISKVPDGIMLQTANFDTLFSAYSLYFYDPTFAFAVPDVRWLSGKATTTTTSIVRALLNGPAPYLLGAVASAFPNGMELVRDSVPVNNGVAQVDLTAQPLLDASVKSRQQMQAQLMLTLRNLNTVTSVTLRADTREVDLGTPDQGVPAPLVNNQVPPHQVALYKGQLVRYADGASTQIEGLPALAKYAPSHPAVSYGNNLYAFLNGDHGRLYAVSPGQPERQVASGVELTAPSFSPQDWLWTATGDQRGTVIAVPAGTSKGQPSAGVVLKVQWLQGRTVTSFRVSRDGSRALVISEQNGVSTVQITGILRSGDLPKDLTQPITLLNSVNASEGVWLNETSVAVMRPSATGPVEVEILNLKAAASRLAPLKGMLGLSGGNGVLDLYAGTAEGLFARVGNGWSLEAKGVTDPAFAG